MLHAFLDSGINSGTAPLGRPHILEPCSISGTSSTNPKSRSLEVRHNNKSNKSFSLRLDPRNLDFCLPCGKNSAPSRCVTTEGLNFTECDPPFVLYYCVYFCLRKGYSWISIDDDSRRLPKTHTRQHDQDIYNPGRDAADEPPESVILQTSLYLRTHFMLQQ